MLSAVRSISQVGRLASTRGFATASAFTHRFLPHNQETRSDMLETIGAESVEELFKDIPGLNHISSQNFWLTLQKTFAFVVILDFLTPKFVLPAFKSLILPISPRLKFAVLWWTSLPRTCPLLLLLSFVAPATTVTTCRAVVLSIFMGSWSMTTSSLNRFN